MDWRLFPTGRWTVARLPRRRLLPALLGAALAPLLGPGRATAVQPRRCCRAVCRNPSLCERGDRRHACVPADEPCPSLAALPGYRLDCERVVPNCSDCGKSVCPARDRAARDG